MKIAMRGSMQKSWKKYIEYIVPILHFLFTFLNERVLFIFSGNWSYMVETAKNNTISNTVEMAMVYLLSKVCAGIFIYLFWKLIFGMLKKRIPIKVSVLFGIIFFIGLIMGLIFYPYMFSIEFDNCANYAMAIRFLPTYWHSVYTGVVYAGCLMMIPHPFAIVALQWLAFVCTVGYIYVKVERWVPGRSKNCVFALFLIPETLYVVFNAYRNSMYTILCLFYFSYLFFSAKEKEYGFAKMASIMALSAFIMVWRSEGILIGILGIAFLFLFSYRGTWKRIVFLVMTFVCSFLLLKEVQDVGAKKYYGQDYMIMNTANVLESIFNNPNVNVWYEGAEDDLAAIEAVVPIQVLKEGGTDGLRGYNYSQGRHFNQSMVDDATADAYMSAYYRIICHNIIDYLNVQINNFSVSMQLGIEHDNFEYVGEPILGLADFEYEYWKQGYHEISATHNTYQWENNSIRVFLYKIEYWVMILWQEIWSETGLNSILHTAVLIVTVYICIVEMSKYIEKPKLEKLKYLLLFGLVVGEYLAIFLFMPEGREAYMHPMLFANYLLIYYYVVDNLVAKEKKKLPEEYIKVENIQI